WPFDRDLLSERCAFKIEREGAICRAEQAAACLAWATTSAICYTISLAICARALMACAVW
ncbi:MAG: hypothetical protein ACK4J3_19235, partial [Acinetobacter pittii]